MANVSYWICCLFYLAHFSYAEDISTCKVLADLTTNRLTRAHDGTMGLWSFHGEAKESHATQTKFIFNGDLIDETAFHKHVIYHPQIASTLHPLLDITSDADVDYLKYLILQAKAAEIDGFLVEWSYEGHPSDAILRKLIEVVQNLKPYLKQFCIGINWCDHWLLQHLKNSTSAEVVKAFHDNAQYLLDTLFIPHYNITPTYLGHPVIFLFGGGILPGQFSEILRKPWKIPATMNAPLWIGNYLNMASTENLRQEWTFLLNGTFAWVPHAYRPTPTRLADWDTYTLPQDSVLYQANVSTFATHLVNNGTWKIWAASSCPGEDNRGCAGWGMTLKYLPRIWNGNVMLDEQLKYNVNSTANLLFLPTMNDYNEATVLLPVEEYGFRALTSVLKYASQWKGQPPNFLGLKQPLWWLTLKKRADFLDKIPNVNVSEPHLYLQTSAVLLALKKYANVNNFLKFTEHQLERIEQQVFTKFLKIMVPSDQLYPIFTSNTKNHSYLVDSTHQVFLKMKESTAAVLRTHNFQGILTFDYKPLIGNYSVLRVESSSNRSGKVISSMSRKSRKYQGSDSGKFQVFETNFRVVCQLMEEGHQGQWHHSSVQLLKENQAWNHNGPHTSDLSFMVENNGSFLVKNISLSFYLYIHQDKKIINEL